MVETSKTIKPDNVDDVDTPDTGVPAKDVEPPAAEAEVLRDMEHLDRLVQAPHLNTQIR